MITIDEQIGAVQRQIALLRTHFFASDDGSQEHIDRLIDAD